MSIPPDFTPRENEVIELLLQGRSNKQMALALGISVRAVEFHLSNIYSRMGVSSRTEAVVKLSGERLRESTGEHGAEVLRESAVAGSGELVENEHIPFLLRRHSMKNFLLTGAGLLLTTLVVVLLVRFPRAQQSPSALPPKVTFESTRTSLPQETQTLAPASATVTMEPATPANENTVSLSLEEAVLVSETIPDGSSIPAGDAFTKTWTLQNNGEGAWDENYRLVLVESSHPLGQTLGEPSEIPLPGEVLPGESVDVAVDLTAPTVDGIYQARYRLQNPAGEVVAGSGGDIWVTIVVGSGSGMAMAAAGGISMELQGVDKGADYTEMEICATLPDLQDWIPSGVLLQAGTTQVPISSYALANAKDAATYASVQRCFALGFDAGTNMYGNNPVSVTIQSMRVPAENNLEANCSRAKQQLASLYPRLDFTCGPAGFYYTHVVLAAGLTESEADVIIMDALEQAVYGPWEFAE